METNNEIIFAAIAGVIFMLALALTVIVFVTLHRKKYLAQQVALQKVEGEKKEALLKTIIDTQEEERSRIARNLHDGVNMQIAVIRMNISQHEDHLRRKIPSPVNMNEKLNELDEVVDHIRDICRNLYPQMFANEGLVASLEALFKKLNETNLIHCSCELNVTEQDLSIDKEGKLAYYRICQELLNNILKHSACNKLFVSLNMKQEELLLRIEHNGKVFTNEDAARSMKQNSFGLQSIVNRLEKLKGRINYLNENGKTVIEIKNSAVYVG